MEFAALHLVDISIVSFKQNTNKNRKIQQKDRAGIVDFIYL
jgi:hypothetical protein